MQKTQYFTSFANALNPQLMIKPTQNYYTPYQKLPRRTLTSFHSLTCPVNIGLIREFFLLFATYCLIFLQLQTAIESTKSISQSFAHNITQSFSSFYLGDLSQVFNQNTSLINFKNKPNSAQNESPQKILCLKA